MISKRLKKIRRIMKQCYQYRHEIKWFPGRGGGWKCVHCRKRIPL